ncbi:MAG: CD225/dispanin family protein [Acidimicrobiia bacterium]|nr:CD225/dispanin family protein [Acidimicrobiia bacterium]
MEPVADYLVQSILCLFAFLPTGIVAIFFAGRANDLKSHDEYWPAVEAARSSRIWCWVSLVCGILTLIIWISIATSSPDSGAGAN